MQWLLHDPLLLSVLALNIILFAFLIDSIIGD